jgi:hypothetical protein
VGFYWPQGVGRMSGSVSACAAPRKRRSMFQSLTAAQRKPGESNRISGEKGEMRVESKGNIPLEALFD